VLAVDMSGNPKLLRIAGSIGSAGPIAFFATWTLSAAVQTSAEYWLEPASSLATREADAPWIMILGFYAWGVSSIVLGVALYRALPETRRTRIGASLVVLSGMALLAAGTVRNDCPNGPPGFSECAARIAAGDVSWANGAHNAVAPVIFVSLAAAAWILGRGFRDDARWRPLARYSRLTAPAILLGMPIYGSGVLPGVAIRLLAALLWTWHVRVGRRLSRVADEPGEPVAAGALAESG